MLLYSNYIAKYIAKSIEKYIANRFKFIGLFRGVQFDTW